jgi:chaperonin GroEL
VPENPVILIHEKKISAMKDLLPLLEQVVQASQSAAHHCRKTSKAMRWHPRRQQAPGTLRVAAVKAPGFGDRRAAMLEDIAILTNSKAVTEDLGIRLESVKLEDLGQAKKITIDKDKRRSSKARGRRPPSKDVSNNCECS